jgi:ubiquinone/menaquinone biosynthesis C-methylase UbiE
MALWTDRVAPHLADVSLRTPEVMELRERVCPGLRGTVLEVGFGSGLNVTCYPDDVTAVSAVEPSDVGWRLSARRRAAGGIPINRSGLDGQRLVEPDRSHDAALITFSLCTIPDPAKALAEVRRVLVPGGALHFLDHGLSPDPYVERWQRRLEPLQRRLAGGCHLTRDVPHLLREAGFEIETLEEMYATGPRVSRPWCYVYLGVARTPC